MPLNPPRRRRARARALLPAIALLAACSAEAPRPAATEPPPVDLGPVAARAAGLPDPCEALEAAGAPALLRGARGDDVALAEPMRMGGLCLIQIERGDEPADQTSAAIELAVLDAPAPRDREAYLARFDQGLAIAGTEGHEVQVIEGVGALTVWFPHESGALTLSTFWADDAFLSIEVHGVDRSVGLPWAERVATELTNRYMPTRPERDERDASKERDEPEERDATS